MSRKDDITMSGSLVSNSPPSGTAIVTGTGTIHGTGTVTGRVGYRSWGECRLWSMYNDSAVEITGKGTKKGAISKELRNRIKEVWKKAEKYCDDRHAGAYDGDINFSALSISYKDHGGKTHTIDEYTKGIDPEIVTLMREVNYLAKELGRFAHASQPGVRSNRPANAPAPLEKTSANWIKDHGLGAKEFLASDDYRYLQSTWKTNGHTNLAGEAGDKIEKAEQFISIFSTKLKAKKTALEEELAAINASELDKRIAKRKQIEQIDAQIAKLAQLDKKAIFWNVAHANKDLGAKPMDPNVRLERASEIRNSMAGNLEIHNTRAGNTLKASRLSSRPDKAYLTAYAKDAGELFLHDRWLYEQHLGVESDKLAPKRACAEELVVNVISNLNDLNFDVDEAASSLAIPPGDTRDSVVLALQEARDELNGIPTAPPMT
jgi:hypothetical protein